MKQWRSLKKLRGRSSNSIKTSILKLLMKPVNKLINCSTIIEEETEFLQGDFEEQEVLTCLKMCARDKAPSPDGYTMGFFIKCWEILKHDIMETFHNFRTHGIF